MTNSKNTKKALLGSVFILLLCFIMLLGTTFAWFTDNSYSDTNRIMAGNLDVELYHADKSQPTNTKVSDNTKLFDDVALWEPGAIVWEKLTVKNSGSLALKYSLNINVSDISVINGKSLADVLKVAVLDEQPTVENVVNAATSNLLTFNIENDKPLTAGASDVFYVAIYWAPSASDNDYNVANGALYADLGVTLKATQYSLESDGFSTQYDKDATYEDFSDLPKAIVTEAPEFVGGGINWRETSIDNQTLEAVYVFTAPHDMDTIDECEYKDWVCDFYVSCNKEVPASSIFLGGYYDLYGGWLGFDNDSEVIPANEEIPLLQTMGYTFNYEIIASYISPFKCGVSRINNGIENLKGATFTVKLCLTNPDTGERIAVNTVNYLFD